MIWHSTEAEKIITYFGVDSTKGLPSGVADTRINEFGQNVIDVTKKSSLKEIIFKQIKNYSNVLILLSTLLSFVVYLLYDSANWYFPVLAVLVLAFYIAMNIYSVRKCEKVIDNMKHKAVPLVSVMRDGIEKKIDASSLVPGDILILEQGDYIAADARLIEAAELRCDEKFVTGETVASEKDASVVLSDIVNIKERLNMVYAGSSVLSGSAKAIVTETGMTTEIGKQVSVLKEFDSININIKEKFSLIGKISGIILLISCIVTFFVTLLVNFNSSQSFAIMLSEAFLNSAALLVSVLPEGLPVITGIAVSLSVLYLLKDGIIIKNFEVFNKLSDVSVICADKTGILTKNNMNVVNVYSGAKSFDISETTDDSSVITLLKMASLCTNQSKEDKDSVMYNDSTELAIINSCMSITNDNTDDFFSRYPRVQKIPFDPDHKIMTSINFIDGRPICIIKGAPDYLLSICNDIDIKAVEKQISEYTTLGHRVIAVAFKPLSEIPINPTAQELECNLTFMGLIALEDTLQDEIVSSVKECYECGIKTCMLTGDHKETSKAIARRLGILKDESLILSGAELSSIDDEFLNQNIENYSVFSRISPADKERIVNSFQNQGEVVAVTGDSVNDAPALKNADVGLAVGTGGTDVARGAADIILNNTNFSSVIKAISVSRKLVLALRKAATYLFGCNIGEFLAIFISLITFKKFPLIAVQLLFVNLITDSFPVFSIISDTIKNPYKMTKITSNDKKLFTSTSLITIAVQSITLVAVSVIAFALGKNISVPVSQTLLFFVLCFGQLFSMISNKCEDFFWKFSHFKASKVNIALIVSAILITVLVLTPAGCIIGLSALPLSLFLKALLLSVMLLITGEVTKLGIYIFKKLSSDKE